MNIFRSTRSFRIICRRFHVYNTRRVRILWICWLFNWQLYIWTINNCESFYPDFNELFYKSHPHINIFLKFKIFNVQNNTYIQINSCNLGIQKSVRCNIKKRLINTTNAIKEYKNKKISRMKFLKKVCKNYSKS